MKPTFFEWFDGIADKAKASEVGKFMTAHNFDVAHTGGGCLAWTREGEQGWVLSICDEGNGIGDSMEELYMVGLYTKDGDFHDCDEMKTLAECIAWGEREMARIVAANPQLKWFDLSGVNDGDTLAVVTDYKTLKAGQRVTVIENGLNEIWGGMIVRVMLIRFEHTAPKG